MTPSDDASIAPRKRPTQARARQTVEAILQAAADVFEAHGLEGGTTERIVERAGVSVGSLYQYFPNKRALLAAVAESIIAHGRGLQRASLDWLADNPPPDVALRRFIDCMVALHETRPRLLCLMFEDRALMDEMGSPLANFQEEMVAGLTRYLDARGLPDPHVKALVLHRAVSKLVHDFVLHPILELPSERAAQEIFRLAIGYIMV
ncbi:MAG TPA: TetR/AcrR family transcriptional regulator [Oscillatoriaceae cyanobacterium]